jgi:hypothetical protein
MSPLIPQAVAFLRLLSLVLLIAAITLLSSTVTHAQSAVATGRLEGTVTDPSAAAIADAEVTVRNQNTGLGTTVRSDSEGGFVVLYLDPGTYEVSIQKSGFQKLVLKDIAVEVGTRAILHPQLSVGKIETTITIHAEPPLGRYCGVVAQHGGRTTEHRVPATQRA